MRNADCVQPTRLEHVGHARGHDHAHESPLVIALMRGHLSPPTRRLALALAPGADEKATTKAINPSSGVGSRNRTGLSRYTEQGRPVSPSASKATHTHTHTHTRFEMTDADDMLAFLDEYAASETRNREDDALDGCPDGGKAMETTSKPRRQETVARRLCRNRGRERQRRELLELRHEVHVLRSRLMQLLKKKKEMAPRRWAAACGDAQTHPCALPRSSAWRALASRQNQRRQAAEEEHARLRARVVEQQHVIKSLQRILARYSADTGHSPTASSRLYVPAWRAMCADGDPRRMMQIFAELVVDVKVAHARTDLWVPTHWSSSLTNGRYRDSRVKQLSPTQLMIETVNLRLMPFPYRKAGRTYWDVGVNHHCAAFDYFREGSEVEGRATVFCGQAFHDGSGDDGAAMFRLRTHMTIQRFDENDRLIVVNAARSDSIRINGHELRNIHVKEQYWNVFQPPEPLIKDACLMTSFGRVIMEVAGGLNQSPLAVLGATNFFGDRVHLHLNAAVSSVEDKLLDEMEL